MYLITDSDGWLPHLLTSCFLHQVLIGLVQNFTPASPVRWALLLHDSHFTDKKVGAERKEVACTYLYADFAIQTANRGPHPLFTLL